MQKNIVIGALVVAVIAAGVFYVVTEKSAMKQDMMAEGQMDVMTATTATTADMVGSDSMDGMIESQVVMDGSMMKDEMSGSYEVYSPDKLVKAETGSVVLFFHATWCPSCRVLGGNIEENKMAIPSDVTILKVDFDTELELRKKYQVTYQHTLVQVDANGDLIKKWSGSPSLETLVSQIQ